MYLNSEERILQVRLTEDVNRRTFGGKTGSLHAKKGFKCDDGEDGRRDEKI